ncbi:MAG: hypothetical protein L3K26_18780 [Candidatus Hydrogenedentes bacterium]|nr:hypothetical protein [Candidatus Hydrogenedentota bacterium]
MNCYPEQGPAQVSLILDGKMLGTLQSTGREEAIFDVSAGLLTLRAASIFSAPETGDPMDIGAWFQIHSSDNPLV